MANLFNQVFKRAGDLVSYPVKATYTTIKDPKEGLKMWGDLYTHNEHQDQDLFQKGFGIRGWVGDHPQEAAAAAVATIFGGWAAAGAYGAGAGGAAGGAAGASGAGAGLGAGTAAGGVGASTGVGAGVGAGTGASTGAMSGAGIGFGSGTTGATGFGGASVGATPFAAGSSTLSYAPASSTILGGSGGSLTAGGTVGGGSAGATAGTGFGANSVGATPFAEGSSVLSYSPTQASAGLDAQYANYTDGLSNTDKATDWNQISQQLSRMQQQQDKQTQQNQPQVQMAKPGSFNYKQPQTTASSQAQQQLQQLLGANPYSTNPFGRT